MAIEESKDLATVSKEELESSLEAHEKRMKERNSDKAKAEIALQARFNEKDKRSKKNGSSRVNEIFQNFGEREPQNSKNSTCQMGESNYNNNGGQGNFRDEKKRFDKSKERCCNCQRFGHFAKECNANKKKPQGDEAKVARQEFDEENILLVMITKGKCSSKLQDDNNNSSRNCEKLSCDQLNDTSNPLYAEENAMMSMK